MTQLVVRRYRGFTVEIARNGRRFGVEWSAPDGTYFPLPETKFRRPKDAWQRARELIDYQLAGEAERASGFFNQENTDE